MLAAQYFEQLPFPPYPVQEETLLAWFTSDQGVLVLALDRYGQDIDRRSGRVRSVAWQVARSHDTSDRTHRTEAARATDFRRTLGILARRDRLSDRQPSSEPGVPVLVVVAEILCYRLLHAAAFDFSDVFAVVMDEFHSFNHPERGIVWEFAARFAAPSNAVVAALSHGR